MLIPEVVKNMLPTGVRTELITRRIAKTVRKT